MSDRDTELITQPAEEQKKKDLLEQAKDFFGNALGTVKGKDLSQMVESFTSEMTLVAEGLSEDQEQLRKMQDDLSARQTIDTEQMREELKALEKKLSQTEKRLEQTEKALAETDKKLKANDKGKKKSDGLTGVLRQATVMVAIAAAAWVIVTVLNTIFK